jgi:NADH-quinone oxidoreductase subunit N
VFNAALSANAHPTALVWLTVIGLVNSAVASYYYLRLIVVMYMREPVIAEAPAPATGAMRLALVLAAIATIYLGVMPGRVLNYSEAGARDLSPAAAGAGSAASGSASVPVPTAVTPAK